MPEPYYLTTAIAYPNGPPHIGHAYEAIAGDVIARVQRLKGRDVRFITGTDEHGLKMDKTARDAGRETGDLATEMSNYFRDMGARLNISYDGFVRTTEPRHHEASVAMWKAMEAAGDLYLGRYEGWYSVRDEAFYGEDELVEREGGERLSPQGTPVEWTVEETWFFRLSKYRDFLIELNETPGFLEPEARRNEVLSFLRGQELRDLSVSRTSFDWGVPVPGSPGHVMYVWVDALTTYLTGIGFPERDGDFARYWPADLHLIGKDIVRFHAVYWPAFLKSAGLPLPRKIFGHGFLLHRGEKMSKSLGNVVDPLELAERFGIDALRYFLMSEVSFGQDGSWSHEAIVTRTNAELSNSFGNLVQRVLSFIAKNLEGELPLVMSEDKLQTVDREFLGKVELELGQYLIEFDLLNLDRGIQSWMKGVFAANAYIDEVAPWTLRKTNPERMREVLAVLCCAIHDLALAITPVIPSSANKVLDALGSQQERIFRLNSEGLWHIWDLSWLAEAHSRGFRVENPVPIFPRLELPEDEAA